MNCESIAPRLHRAFRFSNVARFFVFSRRSCASCPSLLFPGLLLAHVALSLLFFAAVSLSGTAAFQSSQPDALGSTNLAAACSLEEPGPLSVRLSERVLAYLEVCEKKESNPSLRADIHVAWLTVLWSQKGVPEWTYHANETPFAAAVWQVLKCHPDQVWANICAQRRHQLGAKYVEFYDAAGSWRPDPLTTETLSGVRQLPPKMPPMSSGAAQDKLWKTRTA